MSDLVEMAKQEYESLKAQKDEIERKLKPLEAYLDAMGALPQKPKSTRGRKPKKNAG